MASCMDGGAEQKAVLVATTKLLCDFPGLQQQQPLWAGLRDAAVKGLEGEQAMAWVVLCWDWGGETAGWGMVVLWRLLRCAGCRTGGR